MAGTKHQSFCGQKWNPLNWGKPCLFFCFQCALINHEWVTKCQFKNCRLFLVLAGDQLVNPTLTNYSLLLPWPCDHVCSRDRKTSIKMRIRQRLTIWVNFRQVCTIYPSKSHHPTSPVLSLPPDSWCKTFMAIIIITTIVIIIVVIIGWSGRGLSAVCSRREEKSNNCCCCF